MTTAFHQSKQIKEIVTQLVTGYRPEKIILFGSVARGESTPMSDLDFLVIKNTDKPYFERISEVNSFIPSDRFMNVDIAVFTPEEFQQAQHEKRLFIRQVLQCGVALYEANTQPS